MIRSKIASAIVSFPNFICHPLGSIWEQKIVKGNFMAGFRDFWISVFLAN